MSDKHPLSVVGEKFGGKDKLVDKIVALLDSDDSKEDLKKRLLGVANKKLLKLHGVATTVKEKFGGSHDKLVAAVAAALGRGKDADFVKALDAHSDARLLDILRAAERRRGVAAPKAKASAAKPAASDKPVAKKAAASGGKTAKKSAAK